MFLECLGIEEHIDPFARTLSKVVVALAADSKVPLKFKIMNELTAARAFLPEPFRELAFFFGEEAGFIENAHVSQRSGAGDGKDAHGGRAGLAENARAFFHGGTRGKNIVD